MMSPFLLSTFSDLDTMSNLTLYNPLSTNWHDTEKIFLNYQNLRISVISNDNVNDVDFYEIWHTGVLITTCPGIDIALEEGFD